MAELGIIENDFHDRHDLTPNLCAVYTEKAFRGHGICRALISRACSDLKARSVSSLYLLTDHTSLCVYLGWTFFCMVQKW